MISLIQQRNLGLQSRYCFSKAIACETCAYLQKCVCTVIVQKNHGSKDRNPLDQVTSDETSLAIWHVLDVLFIFAVMLFFHLGSPGILWPWVSFLWFTQSWMECTLIGHSCLLLSTSSGTTLIPWLWLSQVGNHLVLKDDISHVWRRHTKWNYSHHLCPILPSLLLFLKTIPHVTFHQSMLG